MVTNYSIEITFLKSIVCRLLAILSGTIDFRPSAINQIIIALSGIFRNSFLKLTTNIRLALFVSFTKTITHEKDWYPIRPGKKFSTGFC